MDHWARKGLPHTVGESRVNFGTGRDVSDESVADANAPLDVRWYADSYVKIPIG